MTAHNRRQFLQTMSLGSATLALTTGGVLTSWCGIAAEGIAGSDFDKLTKGLLTDWCEGMLKHQINAPDDPKRHGALACPACDMIHGRCWEAIYPDVHQPNRRHLDGRSGRHEQPGEHFAFAAVSLLSVNWTMSRSSSTK